eukprot:353707-Chlamydomonas_euryale.AAC.3
MAVTMAAELYCSGSTSKRTMPSPSLMVAWMSPHWIMRSTCISASVRDGRPTCTRTRGKCGGPIAAAAVLVAVALLATRVRWRRCACALLATCEAAAVLVAVALLATCVRWRRCACAEVVVHVLLG